MTALRVVEAINERERTRFRLHDRFAVGREGAWEVRSPDSRAVLKYSLHPERHVRAAAVVAEVRKGGYPTPPVLHSGTFEGLGYHVAAYVDGSRMPARKLDGESLDTILEVIERGRDLAPTIGEDWSARVWSAVFNDGFQLRDRLQPEAVAQLDELQAATEPCRGTVLPKADLVHGDIGPHNVLVTVDGPVVVDMDDAGPGSRASDLADVLAGATEPGRRTVRRALLAVDPPDVRAIALAYQALHWVWRAIEHGDEPGWTLRNLREAIDGVRVLTAEIE
jgi:hypothetical protein